jgi:hypothetical protein
MALRRFADSSGMRWEVRPHSRSEWEFTPVEDNPGPARYGPPPGHETDPYELEVEALHRLLASARPRAPAARKSPFLD